MLGATVTHPPAPELLPPELLLLVLLPPELLLLVLLPPELLLLVLLPPELLLLVLLPPELLLLVLDLPLTPPSSPPAGLVLGLLGSAWLGSELGSVESTLSA